ncbi:alpha/beta hydrolase [Traorella massiliensis]|uniref:alpha/beta fold hydrolase n=1 Tax=Traorella massiliensis TaxID=1903263 RepID=UPI00248F416E|nr:alpha/beta hydrolase [Traorella massiliensis]
MNINSFITGDQQPLVFLHGWGANMQMMNPHAALLSHDYKCINLDLFGFGKSDEIENYQKFEDYVDALHTFLISKNICDPIFIAHSFGARIAIKYALKYPVKAMILTGAAGIRPPLSLRKKLRIYLHHKGFKMKGSYDYEKASGFLRKVLIDAVNQDLSEEMKKIEVPVLLIWGENDKETPLWMGKKMHELISQSSLIVFKDGDHFAYYQEYARFCFIVKEFLEGLDL